MRHFLSSSIAPNRREIPSATETTYGGGSEDLALGGFRYGGTIGEDWHYRIYGKQKEEAAGFNPSLPAFDDWRQGRAGFRADWEPGRDKSDLFTVQGDYYVGRDGFLGEAALPTPPYREFLSQDEAVEGGNILTRWTHTFDEDSDWSLQTYYDRTLRTLPVWQQSVSTFDVEFQHRFPLELNRHNEIIWGAEYRQIHDDDIGNGFAVDFDPQQKTTSLFSMFVQDEVALVEDRLFFTVGSKFEHNDYTGFEYQPSGRLLFAPDKQHSYWGAISRAVRTPGRFGQDAFTTFPPSPLPFPPFQYFQRIQGVPTFGSENVLTYELGYRAQPEKDFSYDIALFYSAYENSQGYFLGESYFDSYGNLIAPAQFGNGARGSTYGAEITGEWSLSERWRVSGSYSYLHMQVEADPGVLAVAGAGIDPCNQVKAKSSWDLGSHWQFDAMLRYVDDLPALEVPSYVTMDLRLAWQPNKRLEVAVMGRNLLQEHHLEFVEDPRIFFYGSEVCRSVYGKVTWRY